VRTTGSTVQVDERSGDIVEDPDGNLLEFTGANCMKQLIYTLLQTQQGEEIMSLDYGVDYLTFFRNPFMLEPISYLQRIIMNAFAADVDLGLSDFPNVQCVWANEEKTMITVFVSVNTIDGITVETNYTVGQQP
jgi:hypothetical protein